MKRALTVAAILAVCLLAGFGIGTLIGKIMNKESKYSIPEPAAVVDGKMTPEVLLSFGRISDPQMSPDGKIILYHVNYQSVKDNKGCTNLWTVKADGSGRKQLTNFSKSVSNTRWSPDGKSLYFIMGGQMWKAPVKGDKLGKARQISDVPAGISEFAFSPDFANVMYISSIKNPLVDQPSDTDPALDKGQAYITENLMYRHWDHWVTEIPRTFVAPASCISSERSFDILGAEPFELPTEPFGGMEELSWSPDGRYIAYSCRKLSGKQYAFSTNSCIYIYDIVTGATLNLTTSGGYDTNPSWSPDGSKLAWISMERDGYEADRQRLMVADIIKEEAPRDGQSFGLGIGEVREITKDFIYDVAGIYWEDGAQSIIFPATTDAIGSLYRADIASGTITRLTGDGFSCSFGTPFCATDDGRLYTTCNSMMYPSRIVELDLNDPAGVQLRNLEDQNDAILNALDEIKYERIVIKTPKGENLHCWVLYPPHFDASKKYPGVEMFNGGPQTSLDESWSYRWNFRLMAHQGYVVILPNRHGDSGFGQAWKEQISGDYQGLNMEDYLLAGKWFKQQPYAGKLAGVGASYGGFSAYNLMGIHGDTFDCFISHAGIFSEKMLWYATEESWFPNWDNGGLMEYSYSEGQTGPAGDGITFGGLQQAGAPYSDKAKSIHHYANEPETRVTKWHTPILCIHGMNDFRIPYEQGMAAFNAAQMMGVPSKLVIFPEECHWVLQPQNALLWHREFFDWIDKWCKEKAE